MEQKTIGILGGMGPGATVHMFRLIVNLTRAEKDQDHIPIIIYNLPAIPDRSEAILNGGPSPAPKLIKGAEMLQNCGAGFILIPCLTAHYFLKQVIKRITIPIINMIDTTREYIGKNYPGEQTIGLLASTGTYACEIFQEAFKTSKSNIIVPSELDQLKLMRAIYGKSGIKGGASTEPYQVINSVIAGLIAAGATTIIAGCSEIPLVIGPDEVAVPFIDPMAVSARAAILNAGFGVDNP